jgi:hypothetical protein
MAAHVRVTRQGKAGSSERERGFSLSSAPAPLPSYDSLRDGNLRQYFETSSVQRLLQRSGWVDKVGRIVDLDKFKGKLNIIEQAPHTEPQPPNPKPWCPICHARWVGVS